MEIADWDAVFGAAAERAEIDGPDVDGLAEFVECGLRFCVEGFFVGGKCDAAFSAVVLV